MKNTPTVNVSVKENCEVLFDINDEDTDKDSEEEEEEEEEVEEVLD